MWPSTDCPTAKYLVDTFYTADNLSVHYSWHQVLSHVNFMSFEGKANISPRTFILRLDTEPGLRALYKYIEDIVRLEIKAFPQICGYEQHGVDLLPTLLQPPLSPLMPK